MSAPYCRVANELPDLRLWLRQQWQPGGTWFHASGYLDHAPQGPRDPTAYALWEYGHLGTATLWWVSADMMDLLLAAIPGVPDDVLPLELPRPSPSGLVVFEKPWVGQSSEAADATVTVDAVLWGGTRLPPLAERPDLDPLMGQYEAALTVSSYRRIVWEEGLGGQELAMAVQRGALEHATEVPNPTPGPEITDEQAQAMLVDHTLDMPTVVGGPNSAESGTHTYDGRGGHTMLAGASWVPLGRSDWPLVDHLGTRPWDQPEHTTASFLEDRRLLAALWTLTAQEGVANTVLQSTGRQARRRAERAGVHQGDSVTVRVVALRRLRPHHDGSEHASPVHHDHRWYVQGFWRNQAVGKGRTERRLTWVRPHIRGPEGAPIKTKEVVHAWVR